MPQDGEEVCVRLYEGVKRVQHPANEALEECSIGIIP